MGPRPRHQDSGGDSGPCRTVPSPVCGRRSRLRGSGPQRGRCTHVRPRRIAVGLICLTSRIFTCRPTVREVPLAVLPRPCLPAANARRDRGHEGWGWGRPG